MNENETLDAFVRWVGSHNAASYGSIAFWVERYKEELAAPLNVVALSFNACGRSNQGGETDER